MNITDIGQSIYEKAEELNVKPLELVNYYSKKFIRVLKLMGLKPHSVDIRRASHHLKPLKKNLKTIVDRGQWSIKVDQSGIRGSPVKDYNGWTQEVHVSDLVDKIPRQDFYLWRCSSNYPYYKFQDLKGIPGWHNECATLVSQYVKKNFIHYGSIDLKPIHHKNQMALVSALEEKQVQWCYTQPVMVGNDKLSKSLKNYVSLEGENPLGWKRITQWLKTRSYHKKTSFSTRQFQSYGIVTRYLNLKRVPKRLKSLKRTLYHRLEDKKRRLFKLADIKRMNVEKQGYYIMDLPTGSILIRQLNYIIKNYET